MRGLIRTGWYTDVSDDSPWGFYDGKAGRLQSKFSQGKRVRVARGIAHINLNEIAEKFCDGFNPDLFARFKLADSLGVDQVATVLVHKFLENLHIQLIISLIPIAYEFNLRGV